MKTRPKLVPIKNVQVGDVLYVKRISAAHVTVRQVGKTATSGGCRVTVWIDGLDTPWATFRGSQKVMVVARAAISSQED